MVISLAAELAGERLSADEMLIQIVAVSLPICPPAFSSFLRRRLVHRAPAVHDRRPDGCFGN